VIDEESDKRGIIAFRRDARHHAEGLEVEAAVPTPDLVPAIRAGMRR